MAMFSQMPPGGETCFFKKEIKGTCAFRNKVVLLTELASPMKEPTMFFTEGFWPERETRAWEGCQPSRQC